MLLRSLSFSDVSAWHPAHPPFSDISVHTPNIRWVLNAETAYPQMYCLWSALLEQPIEGHRFYLVPGGAHFLSNEIRILIHNILQLHDENKLPIFFVDFFKCVASSHSQFNKTRF